MHFYSQLSVRLTGLPESTDIATNLARMIIRRKIAKIVSLKTGGNNAEIDFEEIGEDVVRIIENEISTLVSNDPLLGKSKSLGEIKSLWNSGSQHKGQFVVIDVFLKR